VSKMLVNDSLSNQREKIPPLSDISTGKKTKEKGCSTMTHFNYFFKNYYYPDYKDEKNLRQYDMNTIKHEEVTSHLVTTFACYLSKYAHMYCNPEKETLKRSSIDQYFSAFRMHLTRRFPEQLPPIALHSSKLSDITMGMRRVKMGLNAKEGKVDSQGTEACTYNDKKSICALCFWRGDKRSAEFLHLFTSCIVNLGRGSEVSNKLKTPFLKKVFPYRQLTVQIYELLLLLSLNYGIII
jgi:hypothetical protein